MVFDADVHAGRQRGDGRLLRQYDEHGSDRVPHDDDGCADNSPMATAEATAEPAPAATMEAMTPAQAGQLAEKIAQAVQQISEIDEGAGRGEQRPRAGGRQV